MEYAIYTDKLTKRFGKFTAVNNLSLQIPQGCIYGLLGSNGSGKSTSVRMLCGVLSATSGTIKILGKDIADKKSMEELKLSIGYMSQKFSLYHNLTVYENIKFYASIYGIKKHELAHRIEEILQLAGVQHIQDKLVSDIPGGWRQRLALGCAIIHHPKILFLDEATSGVDPKARRHFWQIIKSLSQQNITILVITHFMEEAELCDRLGFLHKGRLLIDSTPKDIRQIMPHANKFTNLNEIFAYLVRQDNKQSQESEG